MEKLKTPFGEASIICSFLIIVAVSLMGLKVGICTVCERIKNEN